MFNKKIFAFLSAVLGLQLIAIIEYDIFNLKQFSKLKVWKYHHAAPSLRVVNVNTSNTSLSNVQSSCDGDVFRKLLVGRWHQNKMTPTEVETLKRFHVRVRQLEHNIPRGVQRSDKKCGNLSVGRSPPLRWFRALCDPEGDTPCCFDNHCVNKTVEQCACPDCFDMRTPIQAEFATWRPADPTCEEPRKMSVEEMCGLLGNSTLYFLGDSLVRHVFTAFLLAVTGNDKTGAYAENIPVYLKNLCAGIYMFSEKVCRLWLASRTTACEGTVTLRFDSVRHNLINDIQELVLELAQDQKARSFVFFGVGFHLGLNFNMVKGRLLEPLLKTMRSNNYRWPLLLWAGIHKFGLMRTPLSSVNAQAVKEYNRHVEDFLTPWGVPVFDTFNLTDNVMSFDGQHYGFGINRMKVRILLQYFRQLRSQGLW